MVFVDLGGGVIGVFRCGGLITGVVLGMWLDCSFLICGVGPWGYMMRIGFICGACLLVGCIRALWFCGWMFWSSILFISLFGFILEVQMMWWRCSNEAVRLIIIGVYGLCTMMVALVFLFAFELR